MEFMEAQREDPQLATVPVPVVVVTAFPDCRAEGAAVLMRKPFDLATLLTTVVRFCGGGPGDLNQLRARVITAGPNGCVSKWEPSSMVEVTRGQFDLV
jgi:hypothetical protein